VFEPALASITEQAEAIKLRIQEVDAAYTDLCLFFCENSKDLKSEEFFENFSKFVK
jgi:3-deoxy-D-manno-octulosonate 8-phosphate phosphatase KdsC-like HAD superfamily phosphatase